jgi:hypothetical protein
MSPRASRQKRRREIMEAALRCFVRSGYRRSTMGDVVAESGLSGYHLLALQGLEAPVSRDFRMADPPDRQRGHPTP